MAHVQRYSSQMHEAPDPALFGLIVQSPKCTRATGRVGFYENPMDLGVGKQRAETSIDLRQGNRLAADLRAPSRLGKPATVIRKPASYEVAASDRGRRVVFVE